MRGAITTIFITFTLLTGLYSHSTKKFDHSVKVKKTLKKSFKRVLFNHKIHSNKGVSKCKLCHHRGDVSNSCAAPNCHQGRAGTKQIHKRCIGCHRESSGPTKCIECHKY